MAAEVEGIVVGVDPADLSDNACQLQITPVSDHPRLPREVGEIEPGLYALQFDSTRVHALVRAGSGPLKGEGDAAPTAAEGHPATCKVEKKALPVGPQYSREFGNTSISMNGLQVWPAPNCP